jgi:hypothetical protein
MKIVEIRKKIGLKSLFGSVTEKSKDYEREV